MTSIDAPEDLVLWNEKIHNSVCELQKGQIQISEEIKDWKTARGVLVVVTQYNRKVARSNRNWILLLVALYFLHLLAILSLHL